MVGWCGSAATWCLRPCCHRLLVLRAGEATSPAARLGMVSLAHCATEPWLPNATTVPCRSPAAAARQALALEPRPLLYRCWSHHGQQQSVFLS